MPALNAGDLTAIRSRPIGRTWLFYVYQPVEVWSGTVGGSPDQGDRELTVSTISGDTGSILAGMTCRVTDSGGEPKNYPSKVRVKSYAANVLTVAENAVDWEAGDIVSVVRLWEIWPRIPYIDPDTGTQYKDRDIAYSDDATAQPPKANAGPPAIGTLSGGQCDLVFADTGSFVCPAGGAVTSYQWAAIGGSPSVVAGGEATSTVTYRYVSAGYYYVRLTVTDANGKTGSMYVPVIVDDGTLAVRSVTPGDRRWDNQGWVLSRRLLGLSAETTQDTKFFDGAPCFLIADDTQVADSAFIANRSNLRWSGWLIEDTTAREALDREVSYRAVSAAHILSNVPAFPVGMRDDDAPVDWYEYTDLSVDSVAYLLLAWHSTALWVCDYVPTGEWTDRARPGENCDADDLLSQVNGVLEAAKANVRCDRQGRLYAMRQEWFLSTAEKAARATVMTLVTTDFGRADFGPHLHRAQVREVRASGVAGSTPYLSGAPGSSPLDGGRPTEVQRLAPQTQAELDQWAGQELALSNWHAVVRLRMAGEFDVFEPARGEFVAGTLSGFDSRIPDGPYSVSGVDFEDDHEQGVTLAELELIPEPGMYAAAALPIPVSDPPPAPPPLPLPEIEPDEIIEWPAVVYVATRTGGVFLASDFSGPDGSQPTWVDVSDGLPLDGSDYPVRQMLCAPDDRATYQYVLTGATGTDVTFTRDVYRRYNEGTWTQVLSQAAARALVAAQGVSNTDLGYTWALATDESAPGHVYALWGRRSTTMNESPGIRLLRSTDYGVTWAYFGLVGNSKPNIGNLGVYGSLIYVAMGETAQMQVRVSSDGGSTWDNCDVFAANANPYVHLNPLDAGLLVYANEGTGTGAELVKVTYEAAELPLTGGLNVGPLRWGDSMWFSQVDGDLHRLIKVTNLAPLTAKMYETADAWASAPDEYALAPNNIVALTYYVGESDEFIIYGAGGAGGDDDELTVAAPHAILAADTDDPGNPVGRAGTNAATSPYTDAIPYTCGGLAYDGIQVIG